MAGVDEQAAAHLLNTVLDNGINFIDTRGTRRPATATPPGIGTAAASCTPLITAGKLIFIWLNRNAQKKHHPIELEKTMTSL